MVDAVAEGPAARGAFLGGELAAASVLEVAGVGARRAAALAEAGVESVADLLLRLPRRYLDRARVVPVAEAIPGQEVTLIVRVEAIQPAPRFRGRGRRPPTTATVADASGALRCVWFQGGQYLAFRPGDLVALSGQVEEFRGGQQLVHPEYELVADADDPDLLHTGAIVPLYSSSENLKERGLQSRGFRRLMRAALDEFGLRAADGVGVDLAAKLGLTTLAQALRAAHFPESLEQMQAARRRLALGELLWQQQVLERRRRERVAAAGGVALEPDAGRRRALLAGLPFELTAAQVRVLAEIDADLGRPVPMRRLLHGDVGSGKTLVALAAALRAVEGRHQVAVMAPH
ncbi:MAG: OB-fold nucleic acid binding domain-containing protein [Gemmatimonadota bacterium]